MNNMTSPSEINGANDIDMQGIIDSDSVEDLVNNLNERGSTQADENLEFSIRELRGSDKNMRLMRGNLKRAKKVNLKQKLSNIKKTNG